MNERDKYVKPSLIDLRAARQIMRKCGKSTNLLSDVHHYAKHYAFWRKTEPSNDSVEHRRKLEEMVKDEMSQQK